MYDGKARARTKTDEREEKPRVLNFSFISAGSVAYSSRDSIPTRKFLLLRDSQIPLVSGLSSLPCNTYNTRHTMASAIIYMDLLNSSLVPFQVLPINPS
jgi:hypothetical protein